jgi:ribosomal-protein-alanine N-acetyltransferase
MGTTKTTETSAEGWEVRRAVAADLPGLAALEAVSFSAPWDAAFLSTWLAPERGAVWLLRAAAPGPALAGYALFQLLPFGECELLRVAVAPGLRRRGLAGRLLTVCLASLAAAGRPVCFLEVRASNRAAISLYERLAFAPAGRRAGYYADGEDALLFRRSEPARAG